MRLYFGRILNNIDSLKAFNNSENIAYLILLHSIDTFPAELTKSVPESTFTNILARYLVENNDHLSRVLYSGEYLVNPAGVMTEIAAGFTAQIAQDMLQQYAMGMVEIDEPETYSFRWPYYSQTDFPYDEKSMEETAEEAEILDRLEATLAQIQQTKKR